MLLKNQNPNPNLVVDWAEDLTMAAVDLAVGWMMFEGSKVKLDAVAVQCYDSHHFDERNSDDWVYEYCFVVDGFRWDLKPSLCVLFCQENRQ